MLIGWSGRKTLYSEYELNPLRQPGLTLVFEGIHDGVFPWQNLIKSRSGESDDGNKDEDGASDSSSADDAAAAGITAGAASTASEGQSAAEPPAYTEAEDAGVEEMKALPANAIAGSPDEIPEGVCNPVMQAVDYDVVNVGFLSPDDTEYNTDTEGIFAKNGIYYKLGLVDSTYFTDALFIGDSRTVGLCEYGSLKGTAAFLAKESVNVYNVLDQELRYTDHDGESWGAYVEEILKENQYGKVYVALGVNELGIGTTYMYYEKYREIISLIRELQPDALIYIQGIMHVSYDKSSSDSCRNNTVISQRNMAISTLANGRDIFYIDMNPYVCDEDGDLYEDLSGDGIHLKASAYEYWDRSLMENAIVTGE
jgi:lysophospholipase L1-like esterase